MKDKIYVRNVFGDIYKVDDLTDVIYKTDVLYNRIVNQSNNIIDLIQIGDFVNGYRILAMEDSIYKNSKRVLIYKNQKESYERWIYIQEYDGKIYMQDDIVEILTKEKYEQNCFKVVE